MTMQPALIAALPSARAAILNPKYKLTSIESELATYSHNRDETVTYQPIRRTARDAKYFADGWDCWLQFRDD